ncbi:hypothetical protein ACFQDD_02065 [Halorubrum pallidum]|uniref:Uncharacterized protein n=1 Tax=Halorubrum pallidum TaxID=1526114 RepID=A0ABD5T420_9EURY
MSDGDVPEFDWWPTGAKVRYVWECNCDYCRWLFDRLKSNAGYDYGSETEATASQSDGPDPEATPPSGIAPLTEFEDK